MVQKQPQNGIKTTCGLSQNGHKTVSKWSSSIGLDFESAKLWKTF